jgi:glyoxylase-like metal-dependent hydrolase (beta-lactamase superfamily II)
MVVDPGSKWKKIMGLIDKNRVEVTAIVLTHGHGDHIAAAFQLMEKTDALLFRHPSRLGAQGVRTIEEKFRGRVRDLEDGGELKVGPFGFEVIHTPGHSPGGVSLFGEGVLFSGDLLFKGSVGRSDLDGGDFSELRVSLIERIAHLPDDTKVLPGHGPSTTLGAERKTNPYLGPTLSGE